MDEETRPDAVLRCLRAGDYALLTRAELSSLRDHLDDLDPWGDNLTLLPWRRRIREAWPEVYG